METGANARTAIVFPGMGPTRFADVAAFMLGNPSARRLVARADRALGYSLTDHFRDSGTDYTEAAQVAFMVNCLALADWAGEALGIEPQVCAGPSFGGKAAAAYSGALPFEDAVRMTAALARCTEDYFSREHTDIVTHSFVRVPEPRLRELLAELEGQEEWYDLSCRVDHDFHMVSLREGKVDWLQARVRSAGGLSLYTMRPPMHSAAFEPLRRRAAEEVLDGLEFADPRLPVVDDHDGTVLTTGEGVRTMLLDGFVRALRWPVVVETLLRLDVARVCVAGQDSLFGRVPVTTKNFTVVPVNPRVAMAPQPVRSSGV
ncbi:[acyl-carrier-protein] S-malonyltransferase [Streptosporangium becharense]|uniref:[acyl-carrier-protein] S-malonyltransferase n=1 Tax=Streptosporangium becharense TaxID=1816182 RepID=A0A7W9ICV0_9ACTN|nr:ACP S-malonyltransferase [Streptosporangium becharense]MBB2913059.1 [acyl-carrier-protein] S-malonyltransferase [Streptosporangium becharense]MBB5818116.1 [acyl-carrier-protein] S-malonyltransferase [Streptosporangium becharense]